MKRIFTLIALIGLMAAGASAQTPIAALSHQGNLTFFESGTALADAVKASVAGDTVFLSEGDFYAVGFDLESYNTSPHIDKAITIVGNGRKSRIMDVLRIKFPGNPVLTNSLFDGVYLEGLEVMGSVTGLELKKCHIEKFKIRNTISIDSDLTYDETNTVKDLVIDRCYLGTFGTYYMDTPVPYSFKIYNSKIKELNCGARTNMDGLLYNCHVYSVEGVNPVDVYFISSIIECCRGGLGKNCLYGTSYYEYDQSENFENSIAYDTESVGAFFDDNLELVDKYKNPGLTGVDGTDLGIYGGEWHHYSETPSMPSIDMDKSTFELDNVSNKMKVNVFIKSN